MRSPLPGALRLVTLVGLLLAASASATTKVIPAEVLEDKIRGGLVGQILGNLNGLPHEFKYIAEPGNVERYTPALPEGARTDDDTDIEWIYVIEMQRSGQLYLPPQTITQLWKRHINTHIWCANLYARRLMDLGIDPPYTGRLALNPWSNFNIGGSFLAETWGLIAPGMPKTAAKIGLHYTTVGIDAEPAQCTQFVTAMIATAFFENDVEAIIDAGLRAVDGRSVLPGIAADVRRWCRENPEDWRITRRQIHDKFTKFNGEMADRNGYELNMAATIAALIYGKGDFTETLRHAFNFGWDADNNAATGGAIIGVIKGKKWMDEQGWVIRDEYRNTTRPGAPLDETITRFGDRLVDLAQKVIAENGGKKTEEGFEVVVEEPANIAELADANKRRAELAQVMGDRLELELEGDEMQRARAAYLAICLGEAERLRVEKPERWARAIEALGRYGVVKELFSAPRPDGPIFRDKAQGAGLVKGD